MLVKFGRKWDAGSAGTQAPRGTWAEVPGPDQELRHDLGIQGGAAGCTQSADLAGIYLAVEASYEQQIVNANQQALGSAVQQYKAAYAKELKQLPALLKTAKANAFPKAEPTSKG